MPATSTRFALVILVALSAAACGADPAADGGDGQSSPASEPASETPAATDPAAPPDEPAPVVAEVLDFEAPLLDGGTLRGSSLAGRDVAFWFWAPW